MGSFSIFHWLLVLAVILILFGAGKLPSVMGDLAKGIKAFRAGLKDDNETAGETGAKPATTAAVPPPAAPSLHAQPLNIHTGDTRPPTG
ncbi:MAG: twin-arginine translocase TatA/TatE family subunit [Rhodospirillaceae bacterium]